MHVELTFMEVMAIAAMFVGALWAILKVNAGSFTKNLDLRFSALETSAKERATAQDLKLVHIDTMMITIQRVELDSANRHASYVERFCTKEEMRTNVDRHGQTINEIFKLLRSVDEKLSNKVNRSDCKACPHS